MKILHLATFLQGGAGRVITDLALHQHSAGHDIRVVASRSETPGFGNYTAYLDALRDARVPLLLVDSLFHRDYTVNLRALQQIDSAVGSVSPDIIHAHAAVPALMGLLLAGTRRESTAVITTMHGWSQTKTPAQAEADVRALNLSHRVVTPSVHSSNLLQDIGVDPGRVHVVPYGVTDQLPTFSERDRQCVTLMREARRDGRLVFACVGTVGERKRQRLIIEALRRLPDATPYLIVFIGDGEVDALRSAVDAAGVANSVVIHGYSPAARRLASEADALVLPSSREGQPLSILESFCDGNLVVASDIPELAELIADGETGWLFEPDSAQSLATAFERLTNTSSAERERIVSQARKSYRSAHVLADMNHRYLNHYTDLAFEDRDASLSLEPAGAWNA